MQLKAYCDGGAWPNPGGDARYGWWIEWDGKELAWGKGVAHARYPKTNNTAEFAGLVACLNGVIDHFPPGATSVVIHTDSQLLRDAVALMWGMQKSPHLADLRNQGVALMRQLREWVESVTLVWIPRHLNARADEIAGVPTVPDWVKSKAKYVKKKKHRYRFHSKKS